MESEVPIRTVLFVDDIYGKFARLLEAVPALRGQINAIVESLCEIMNKTDAYWILDVIACDLKELVDKEATLRDKLAEMPYNEYLQTDHWKFCRNHMLDAANNQCHICSKDKNLNVHHKNYENRGCETTSDLVVLCKGCHATFHGKLEKAN